MGDDLPVAERAVHALVAYAFPHSSIHHAWRRARQIGGDDMELVEYLESVLSFAEQG